MAAFYEKFCTTDPCSSFTWNATSPPPSNASLKACKSWDATVPGCINGDYPLQEVCGNSPPIQFRFVFWG